MKFVSIAILSGVIAITPVSAKDKSPAAKSEVAEGKVAKQPDPNGMRCRKVQVTGSLIKRKICMTNAKWAALEQQEKREARKMVDHANQGTTSGR